MPKRRLRVRRKVSRDEVVDAATDPLTVDLGCCLVEAVAGAGILAAVLIGPARMGLG